MNLFTTQFLKIRMLKKLQTPKSSSLLFRLAFVLFCLFSPFATKAQNLRIACIGNSITAGARLTQPLTESYPAVLSSKLKQGEYLNYGVKNYVIGGATILKFG